MNYFQATLPSPVGPLMLVVDEKAAVVRIGFPNHPDDEAFLSRLERAGDCLHDGEEETLPLARQLEEYFAGARRTFELPLSPLGTPFQRAVWRALCDIPFGETRSYGEIALAIGRPAASRAVGAANGANPIPIVIPCHRVIGADASLTGYGGGLPTKRFLLRLEGIAVEGESPAQLGLGFE